MRSSELYAQYAAPASAARTTTRTRSNFFIASKKMGSGSFSILSPFSLWSNRREHRTQRLRLASHRPARAARVVPGVDVEMGPRDRVGHEVVEEERRDDGAREGPLAGIAEVGDVAREKAPVAAPEGQAPERIVERLAGRSDARRERL